MLDDRHEDNLLNPTVVIQVLSRKTELHDRGRKFQGYRSLPSVQEYLLIWPDEPYVEHFVRQSPNEWRYSQIMGLEQSVELPSIGCTLPLADVYRFVTFEERPSEE